MFSDKLPSINRQLIVSDFLAENTIYQSVKLIYFLFSSEN